jgi:hypothetical protein
LGFIDELMNATIESLSKAATNAFSTVVVSSQDNTKMNLIKTELTEINAELDATYSLIGKKYVEYVSETNEMPGIDVKELLILMEPKLEKKNEFETQLIAIEKKIKEQAFTQEKERYENEFKSQKEILDKAKEMDIISKDDYAEKLKQYTKKRDNFQAIRNIKKQYELGIISYEELQMKLRELT